MKSITKNAKELLKLRNLLNYEIDNDKLDYFKKEIKLYREKINNAKDKGDTYYNLRNCAYLKDFEKDRIIWTPVNGIYYFKDTSELDGEVDNIVYELYNLTDDEIKIIEW
ncbi:hypothetical protein [uncultured Brachyspira sp.]|uniref:hypothetical protein n=1 Tax=uncultured Brachyspira sp. TaxID=221953 RepID=UPI0025D62541|nr:hypothetical protein [uncultured Brachyspira sp.]